MNAEADRRTTPGGVDVGGWLLKARRDVWDVVGAMAGREPLTSWRLTPSYRVGMIRVGDPVVLWLTGSTRQMPPPGVWAVGTVTGDIDERQGSGGGWIDLEARDQVRPRVPVNLSVLEQPLLRTELAAHADFAEAEILVAPRVGNPGVLRRRELAVIADLVDGATPEVDTVIDRWDRR